MKPRRIEIAGGGGSKSPAEKKVSNFKALCLTSLVWKLQSWQASGAKRFHGKPPLIGLGVHRRSGGGRVQTFAIIRFLFGRALRPEGSVARRSDPGQQRTPCTEAAAQARGFALRA